MRIFCAATAVSLAFFLVFCPVARAQSAISDTIYQRYQDIPGVTPEEIAAIERIKRQRSAFVYGVTKTTESFIAKDNAIDGFSRRLCERLSGLFGILFLPRLYEWDALTIALHDNSIDFTGELSPTPERSQRYFMTAPMIQRTIRMFTDRNGDSLARIARDRPVRAAFLEGSTTYAQVRASWKLPHEALFLENEMEAVPLLQSGEIDVYLDESSVEAIFEDVDFIRSHDYFPLLYSPLSLTSNSPELQSFISVMQKYLQHGGFYELTDLYKVGLEDYLSYKILKLMTDEEKNYISAHNTPETAVPFAAEADNYPIAFYNTKEKAFQGIAVDVLRRVTRLTGLHFRFATGEKAAWPEILSALEEGRVAIVSELQRSEKREGRFLWVDEPYCEDTYALLSRTDYPDMDMNQVLRARVGLIVDTGYADLFRVWFPANSNTHEYGNIDDAFAALEAGEIDLLMGSQNLLLSLTNYMEKPGFKANFIFRYPYQSGFGLHKDAGVLRSILNKALPQVDTTDIADRWRRKVFDYNSKMLKDTLPYLALFVVLLAVGLAAVIVLLLKNRRMSGNLERIVAQRTAELEQASRAKTDFLSRMSHEMRTPMNAIIGMCKIAENTEDTARLRYCLGTIGSSSAHLLELINDILDMSKIEAGKFELSEGPLHLEKMLIKICNLILDKSEQKRQTLNVTLGARLHQLYRGDELRLSQVVMNLLSNAVKFTPQGGSISLEVTEMRESDAASVLRFCVRDTGIGMTSAQIARLFNPFEQADGSIAVRFGGTGLGLAISKSIVEKMDGRIWVDSQPGQGSTFTFVVHVERLAQKAEEGGVLLRPLDAAVLFVGGTAAERERFCAIAADLGLRCETAANAGAGLALAQSAAEAAQPYGLVFLDASLPDGRALDVAREFAELVEPGRVIFFTSFTEWSAIAREDPESGGGRFLSRPLFPSLVAATINAVLGVPEAPPETTDEEAGKGDGDTFSQATLLLVEDVAVNREIFLALLEETGIRIDTAENGLEAVRMFENHPERYDLIIMDLQMPVMDGYTATRMIRALPLPRAGTIPIIAMTANAFKEDIDKCLEAGMNNHMSKPINEKEVKDKIRLALA